MQDSSIGKCSSARTLRFHIYLKYNKLQLRFSFFFLDNKLKTIQWYRVTHIVISYTPREYKLFKVILHIILGDTEYVLYTYGYRLWTYYKNWPHTHHLSYTKKVALQKLWAPLFLSGRLRLCCGHRVCYVNVSCGKLGVKFLLFEQHLKLKRTARQQCFRTKQFLLKNKKLYRKRLMMMITCLFKELKHIPQNILGNANSQRNTYPRIN